MYVKLKKKHTSFTGENHKINLLKKMIPKIGPAAAVL